MGVEEEGLEEGVEVGNALVELEGSQRVDRYCEPTVGLGLTVRYSAVGVGVDSALQCGWGWG